MTIRTAEGRTDAEHVRLCVLDNDRHLARAARHRRRRRVCDSVVRRAGYQKTFDDYGLSLTWLTKTVLRLSVAVAPVAWLIVPVAVAFCGVPVLVRHAARMPRLGTAFAAAELALLVAFGTACLFAMKLPMGALAVGLSK